MEVVNIRVLNISFRKMDIYERRAHRRTYSEPVSRIEGSGADISSMDTAYSLRREADRTSEEAIINRRRSLVHS
jgi:hypothetical protein